MVRLHDILLSDKLGLQSLLSRGGFPMVGDHSRQYKTTIFVLGMAIQLHYATLRLTPHHISFDSQGLYFQQHRRCWKAVLQKPPECPSGCAELAELQDILKMCKLPFFLYSFHWKEVITVKCWGAGGGNNVWQGLIEIHFELWWRTFPLCLLLNPLAVDDPRLIKPGMMEYPREQLERERETPFAYVCECLHYFSFSFGLWEK